MHNRQLPRQRQHSTLTRRVRHLRRRAPDQRHHARRIDHAAPRLALLPEAAHSVFAAVPHAPDVHRHGALPHVVGALERVAVARVHDARVVEHDVHPSPGRDVIDRRGDRGFVADVDDERFEAAGGGGGGWW